MKTPQIPAQFGMVAGAALATACCWLPLSLGVAGVSSVGLGLKLEALRPLFYTLTAVFVAWSFYAAFLRRAPVEACAADGCAPTVAACPVSNGRARTFFFVHLVVAGALLALPYATPFGQAFAQGTTTDGAAAEQEGMMTTEFTIQGMTCMGCVNGISNGLRAMEGVTAVEVTLDPGVARVTFDPATTSDEAIRAKVASLGYEIGD